MEPHKIQKAHNRYKFIVRYFGQPCFKGSGHLGWRTMSRCHIKACVYEHMDALLTGAEYFKNYFPGYQYQRNFSHRHIISIEVLTSYSKSASASRIVVDDWSNILNCSVLGISSSLTTSVTSSQKAEWHHDFPMLDYPCKHLADQ